MVTKEICENKILIVIEINKVINFEYARETDAKNAKRPVNQKAASYFELLTSEFIIPPLGCRIRYYYLSSQPPKIIESK